MDILLFSTIQGIVVLHKDKSGTADSRKTKPVLHSHFEGSLVDPITGKNVHFNQGQIRDIQRWADEYAREKYGWMPFTRTREKLSHNYYRTAVLRAIAIRGSYSWKMDMTARIERHYTEATSYRDFMERLKAEGIGVISSRKDRSTGEISKLPELRFTCRYRGRDMVVKASTLSKMLTPPEMKKRFPELEVKTNGQIFGFTVKGQGYTPKSMGKGLVARQPAGRSDSGQGHIRVDGGKIDFRCIECTHEKEICEQCSRYDIWQGGIGNERNARTR